MQKKLLLAVGFAAGYVVGSSRGRAAYIRLRDRAQDAWSDPRVQKTVDRVEDVVRDKVPVVGPIVADAVDKIKPVSTPGPAPATD